MKKDAHIFSIGTVAKMLDISVHTIRMYEREKLILIRKTESGRRIFSMNDVERLQCIRNMISNEGMNIVGIKRMYAMIPCWKLNENCLQKDYTNCSSYEEAVEPCWALPKKPGICMDVDCYECPVYNVPFNCTKVKKLYHANQEENNVETE